MDSIYRHENKYLISNEDAVIIEKRLLSFMKKDSNEINDMYQIRSLYFDDEDNSFYFEKENGVAKRYKYRIRMYNHNCNYIILEKKIKNDNLVSKIQERISVECCYNLIDGDYDKIKFDKGSLLEEFVLKSKLNRLLPSIIIDYNRKAFKFYDTDVRITIDSNVSYAQYKNDIFNFRQVSFPICDDGCVLLEIKYNYYLPKIISDVIYPFSKIYTAFSKYNLGVDKRSENNGF